MSGPAFLSQGYRVIRLRSTGMVKNSPQKITFRRRLRGSAVESFFVPLGMESLVFKQFTDLTHTSAGDAVTLFDGKRMFSWFEFNVRPRTNPSRVDVGLQ